MYGLETVDFDRALDAPEPLPNSLGVCTRCGELYSIEGQTDLLNELEVCSDHCGLMEVSRLKTVAKERNRMDVDERTILCEGGETQTPPAEPSQLNPPMDPVQPDDTKQ